MIANGIAALPIQIETVSDTFGRVFLRDSDAVWIISEGVAATDVAEERLAMLPIGTSETKGPIRLSMRTDTTQTVAMRILIHSLREAASLEA